MNIELDAPKELDFWKEIREKYPLAYKNYMNDHIYGCNKEYPNESMLSFFDNHNIEVFIVKDFFFEIFWKSYVHTSLAENGYYRNPESCAYRMKAVEEALKVAFRIHNEDEYHWHNACDVIVEKKESEDEMHKD